MSLPTRLRSQRWERDEIDYGGDWEPMNDHVEEEEPEEVIPSEELKPERFEIPEPHTSSSPTNDSDLDLGVDRLELESLEEFQLNVQIGEDGELILEDLNPPTPPLQTIDHFPTNNSSPQQSEAISVLSDKHSISNHSVPELPTTPVGHIKDDTVTNHTPISHKEEFQPIEEDNESLIFQSKSNTNHNDHLNSFTFANNNTNDNHPTKSVVEDTPKRYSGAVSLENGHNRNVSAGVLTLESLIHDVQSDIVSGGGYDNLDEVASNHSDYDYDYDDYQDVDDEEHEDRSIRPLSTVQSGLSTPKPPPTPENELHPVGSSGSLSTGNFSFETASKTDLTSDKEPTRRSSTNTFDMGGWKPNTDAYRGNFVNQNFANRSQHHDDVISIPATIDVTLPSVSEIPDEEEEYATNQRKISATSENNNNNNNNSNSRISSSGSTLDKIKSRELDSANTSTTIVSSHPVTQKYPTSNWGKIMSLPQRGDRIQELTKALSAGSDYETGLTDWLTTTLKSNDSSEFINIGNLATKIFQESDKNPRRPSTRTRVLHVKDKVHVASDLGKRFLNRGKKILK
ncbi:hypothetical protein DFJ63DRAFT_34398 [Scheffersomyces coipomensis]|uniref:uncharacterized protein n=1 Tax=Scheffersomyces coipomensis TaxID=1788519 RepID=UPI00315DF426